MLRTARSVIPLALVALLCTSPAFAQAIDTTKIGAINLSYVARMSKAGREGLSRIDDTARKRQAEVESLAADLQKQQAELQKTGVGLSPRALADLQRAFEKSKVDLQRLQQDAKNEIESMQTQFELEFRTRLTPVIDAVSKEKGLQFVFGLEQAAIVWWNPALDISEDVVKRLDAAK
jgi:Skp family chaperone for outer membrane proteins